MTCRGSAAFLLFVLCATAALDAPAARADIGVALADPTTIGVSQFTHAGHSLVYLSGVCAASPIHARLCEPGEQGSIVTMYPNLYEKQPYSWNIVPMSLYINGFAEPGPRLLFSSANAKIALQQHARTHFLSSVCEPDSCHEQAHAYWRDLIASTVDRDIFIYAVTTTREQDQAIVDWLNNTANVNRYNTFTNNCSNFTEDLINRIFPDSVHRDVLNDLAMMSPKAAARSFTRWSAKRPDLGLHAIHVAQLPGTVPRSGYARSGTEDAIHMKKYLIPAALIGDHEVAGSFFVAYYLTGRFSLYNEYALYAAEGNAQLESEARSDRQQGHDAEALVLEADARSRREAILGDKESWSNYRKRFRELCAATDLQGLTPRGNKHFFPDWFGDASVSVDENGDPWLSAAQGEGATVGIATRNLLAPASDPRLAVELMLAHVAYVLNAHNHYREPIIAFREDWELLQAALDRLRSQPQFFDSANASPPVAAGAGAQP